MTQLKAIRVIVIDWQLCYSFTELARRPAGYQTSPLPDFRPHLYPYRNQGTASVPVLPASGEFLISATSSILLSGVHAYERKREGVHRVCYCHSAWLQASRSSLMYVQEYCDAMYFLRLIHPSNQDRTSLFHIKPYIY
jgi:hypothetical protein